MAKSDSPIGVFDSGLGGLSVLKEMIKVMPNEDFIYFGDSANAPYGVRTTQNVRDLTISHVSHLLEDGCKAICVACNSATSAAVAKLRTIYPDVPLVGIEPAIKPAATNGNHPKVLVMATPMTIREEKFQSLMSRFVDIADIYQLPCPGLMEFIESGILSGPKLNAFLMQLLWDYIDMDLDAVVLGCTHYPFVKDEIQMTLGGNPQIYDGSLGTARELKRRIEAVGLLCEKSAPGKIELRNSDASHLSLAEKLLYS